MNAICSRAPRVATLLSGMALGLFLVLSSGCDRPSHPLAHVGDQWVGQPEWAAYLEHAGASAPLDALQALTRREIAWNLAERQGLLKGDAWNDFQRQSRLEILGEAYLEAQSGQSLFTEQQVKELYFSHSEERHLLQVLAKNRADAERTLTRLQKGEAFAKVAETNSTDPTVKTNHGDLGWIKRPMLLESLAGPVFSAKAGDWVGPLETKQGWIILLVKEVRTPSEADYQAHHAETIKKLRRMAVAMKKPAVAKELRAEYRLVPDKAVLDRDRTTAVAPGDEALVAGKVAGATITLRDLKLFLARSLGAGGATHSLGAETKTSFMEVMADDIRLAKAAEKAGLDRKPAVKAALWDAQREFALDLFADQYLKAQQVADSDCKAHYDQHQDRFLGVGAVKVNLLVTDNPADMDAAAQEAVKGVPWKQIVAKHANAAATGNWDPGFLELADLAKLLPVQVITSMGKVPLGSLVGPMTGPDGILLFKILERRPGGVLPYEACKGNVRLDYLKTHGRELLDRYLDGAGRLGIRVKMYPENMTGQVAK